MMFFDPKYFLFLAPAMLLALWAQMKVKSTYANAQRMPAPLSGAAAARHVLDSAGLTNIQIEQVPGQLTDHYDPQAKVLRLSSEVYQGRNVRPWALRPMKQGTRCRTRSPMGRCSFATPRCRRPISAAGSV